MSREARSRAAKPHETKRSQPLPKGALHRTGSAVAFTATNVAAETGADEHPLIAVSARNFNTAKRKAFQHRNALTGFSLSRKRYGHFFR